MTSAISRQVENAPLLRKEDVYGIALPTSPFFILITR